MTTVKNIYDYINALAPYDTQEEWDNSGHLLGDFRKPVTKAVLALDATREVCSFSADIGADVVITHHPLIFKPLYSVSSDSAVYILASAGISAICAHTNFDKAECGINVNLANLLGLKNLYRLDDGYTVVGELDLGMSVDDLAQHVSDTLNVSGIRYIDTDCVIEKVGICAGAAEEFQQGAMKYCDCFVTGDMKYHQMLDAQQRGEAIISAGHYETEYIPFMMLREKLQSVFTDVQFIAAPSANPVKSL